MILTQVMVDSAKREGFAMAGVFLYSPRKADELFSLGEGGAYRTFSRQANPRQPAQYLTHGGMLELLAKRA